MSYGENITRKPSWATTASHALGVIGLSHNHSVTSCEYCRNKKKHRTDFIYPDVPLTVQQHKLISPQLTRFYVQIGGDDWQLVLKNMSQVNRILKDVTETRVSGEISTLLKCSKIFDIIWINVMTSFMLDCVQKCMMASQHPFTIFITIVTYDVPNNYFRLRYGYNNDQRLQEFVLPDLLISDYRIIHLNLSSPADLYALLTSQRSRVSLHRMLSLGQMYSNQRIDTKVTNFYFG